MPAPVDVLLADGSTAELRAVDTADIDALRRLFDALSHDSLVMRFLGPHPLTPEDLTRMTVRDGRDSLALVVQRGDALVAMAEYIREPGHPEAEVAFVVADDFQGRGLGTLLLEHLAVHARRHGIRRFVADTFATNSRMLGVFRDAGFARQYERASEVVRVALDIAPSPEAEAAADQRDGRAVRRSMERLLRPRSIAVVGASRRRGSIGHELLRNLVAGAFTGPVYPVNPSATSVASLPAWPDVASIPQPVDLAVVTVPAVAVPAVVEDCGRSGVGGLVVVSAGFAEAGDEGRQAQEAVTRAAHRLGMRLIGPNCFGVVNADPAVSMNATFAPDVPRPGRVGFASQSGGLGIAILAEAANRQLGLSSFVSMGNKADVSGNDLLTWWESDSSTDVMLLYLESFGNPRNFSRIARRISRTKPIVAVKSGRSGAGRRAASSHTAALASPDRAVDALFEQTGVIRADTVEELFDVSEVLAHQPVPHGVRVGIVGNAGGPGVLAADACAGHGLQVPELSPATQQQLRALLAPGAGIRNPIDMVAAATAESYRQVLDLLLAGGEVDALVVIFTPPLITSADDVADAVVAAVDAATGPACEIPVVAAFLGAASARTRLHRACRPVPAFTYPESAALALARAARYGRWLASPPGQVRDLPGTDPNATRRLVGELPRRQGWLTGAEALAVLASYGIPVADTVPVTDAESAGRAAAELGGRVAVKALGPTLVHKSDLGGVRLGLTPDEVPAAFRDMGGRLGDAMDGAVVQRMAPEGVENLAGFVRDPSFGPLLVFGAGGTAVELLDDTVTRVAPLTDGDARAMVRGRRTSVLLEGYRGTPAVDIDGLEELVLRLSKLADDLPELAEADCNPVIATPDGPIVVDCRIRVSDVAPEGPGARHLQ